MKNQVQHLSHVADTVGNSGHKKNTPAWEQLLILLMNDLILSFS